MCHLSSTRETEHALSISASSLPSLFTLTDKNTFWKLHKCLLCVWVICYFTLPFQCCWPGSSLVLEFMYGFKGQLLPLAAMSFPCSTIGSDQLWISKNLESPLNCVCVCVSVIHKLSPCFFFMLEDFKIIPPLNWAVSHSHFLRFCLFTLLETCQMRQDFPFIKEMQQM